VRTRNKAIAALVLIGMLLSTPPASADTTTVWRHNGLAVTYTHTRYISGLLEFQNASDHRFRFACSIDTRKGLGEAGQRLRPHHHAFGGIAYGQTVGGTFHWIGCRVSTRVWPRLPIQLAHEWWRSRRLEVLFYRSHVYMFNRVHTWTSYQSCSWTTGGGATTHSYPSALPLHGYRSNRIESAKPDVGSLSC